MVKIERALTGTWVMVDKAVALIEPQSIGVWFVNKDLGRHDSSCTGMLSEALDQCASCTLATRVGPDVEVFKRGDFAITICGRSQRHCGETEGGIAHQNSKEIASR